MPGTAPPQESRPVGYGVIRAGVRADSRKGHYIEQQLEHHRTRAFQEEYLASVKRHGPHFDEKYLWDSLRPIIPYLRDGSLEGRFPRHFVPGYDRCCPSGTRLQTFRNAAANAARAEPPLLPHKWCGKHLLPEWVSYSERGCTILSAEPIFKR